MQILSYDEVDPESVSVLNWTCFHWLLTPELAERLRRQDPWLPDNFALYAVDGGVVRAQVGTCTVDTETTEGVERVGFVWGVCTRPDSARKGYATALLEESQRLLLEDDVRFAVLGTRRSFIAYDIYHDMGYRDLGDFGMAVKRCGGARETEVVFTKGLTPDEAHDLFQRHSDGLLGFVHRFKGAIDVRELNFHDGPYMKGTFSRDGETIGYAVGLSSDGFVNLFEMCCVDIGDVPDCITALERHFKPTHIMYDWTPRTAMMDQLVLSGFTPVTRTWGRFMTVDLTGELDIGAIEELYGVPEDRFTMSGVDAY